MRLGIGRTPFQISERADVVTTRRIIRLFAPYRRAVLLVVLLVAIFSALNAAVPLLTQVVFDRALFGAGGPRPGLLALIAALAAVVAAGAAGVDLAQAWISARMAQRIIHSLRTRLFGHLQRMPLGFFAAARSGEIQSRLANDTDQIEDAIKDTLPSLLGSLLGFLFALGAMFSLSWRLAAVTLCLAPAILWVTARSGRALKILSAAGQRARAEIASIAAERLSLGGITLARVHGRDGHEAAVFAAESERLAGLGVRASLAAQSVLSAGHIFFVLTPYIVFVAAGLMDGITPGTLMAFVVLQSRLYQPLWQILHISTEFRTAQAAFERVFEYLDLPPGPPPAVGGAGAGEVSVAGASYAYAGPEGETRWALREVTLDLPAASTTLIVGPNGSGKTTLGHLLAGLYEPAEGSVRTGGRVCLAPQEALLFQGSIADNLRYAAPDAGLDDLIAACTTTRMHERIMALPDGYDSVVGERGALLSGGERQRLALARALLSDAPVLVLDEATSALDPLAEREVVHAVLRRRRGLTTVMITHRFGGLDAFDTVVVLDGGRVAESGTPPQLLGDRHGLYARMVRAQAVQRRAEIAANMR
ncbi:ABC transporter ATP-binding protein [Nonomuraea sp. NPDC049158]|uniref:ABC transporter ATP-binding protein n=1 Tax=Nonomuraea sp. NPDC049158 TaxID=3155649 RepID=UPI0033F07160